MPRRQYRWLGIATLPTDLSNLELEEFFRRLKTDIEATRARFRPKHRIGAAIQLAFMRLSGNRLAPSKLLPRKLLEFVGKQVGQPAPSVASLRSLYKRENTRLEHYAWSWSGSRSARMANDKNGCCLRRCGRQQRAHRPSIPFSRLPDSGSSIVSY